MKKKTKDKPIHSGHRSRMREKVRNGGLNALSEHEVVELLLNYAIPRQNTNPLAHKLIDNFGSLSNVIDADYYDLLKVDGVGSESALFFTIISSLIKLYKINKAQDEDIIIRNTFDAVKYFRNRFGVDKKEIMHIACMSKSHKVVSSFNFEGSSDSEVNFNLKTFMDKINQDNVNSIIMFHTHPYGDVTPSDSDLQTTQRCVYMANLMGINVDDHLILNEKEFCSMNQMGYIETMRKNSAKLVSIEDIDDDLFDVKKLKTNKFNFAFNIEDIDIEDKIKNKKK